MIKSLILIAIILQSTVVNTWSSRINQQDNFRIQNKVISKGSPMTRNHGALNHRELSNITKNAPVRIEDLMSIMNYASPKKMTTGDYPAPPRAPRKNPRIYPQQDSPCKIKKEQVLSKKMEMIEYITKAENEEKETQKLIQEYASMRLEDTNDIKD
jgi:hypothetical protein